MQQFQTHPLNQVAIHYHEIPNEGIKNIPHDFQEYIILLCYILFSML